MTTSGGTTLPFSGTLTGPKGTAPLGRPRQTHLGLAVYTWAPTAQVQGEPLAKVAKEPNNGVVGSGGGFSQSEAQPSYQQGVAGTGSFTAVP